MVAYVSDVWVWYGEQQLKQTKNELSRNEYVTSVSFWIHTAVGVASITATFDISRVVFLHQVQVNFHEHLGCYIKLWSNTSASHDET